MSTASASTSSSTNHNVTRTIQLGTQNVVFPSPELQPLVDSKPLLDSVNYTELRERFSKDGYLYLRQGLDREAVLKGRQIVIEEFKTKGNILVEGHEQEGILRERCMAGCIPFMEGKNHLTHSPAISDVLQGPRITKLMSIILDTDVVTFDFKWLRAGWNAFFTGAHVDRVYMGRGSQNVITTWIPFDDATLELGALAVLEGSHRLPGFQNLQKTYGELDIEKDNFDGTGWFSLDPFEMSKMDSTAQWRTIDYQAGDIIMFNMRVVHMSTANTTNRVRISCDIRWQPAADPQDDRYFGEVDRKVKERQIAGAWTDDQKDTKQSNKDADEGSTSTIVSPVVVVVPEKKRTIEDMKHLWGFM